MPYENCDVEKFYESRRTLSPELFAWEEKVPFKFLYIGNDGPAMQQLRNQFQVVNPAANFSDAKKIIDEGGPQITRGFYDAIFIDAPMTKEGLIDFHSFLRTRANCSHAILIYNGNHADRESIKSLKELDILDDIVNHSMSINYASKVTFLKRFKAHHREPFVPAGKRIVNEPVIIRSISGVLKRGFDIIVALIALIIATPLFLLVSIIIKLESRGPVFYTSLRAGKGYRVFKFYKFRTMKHNADEKLGELAQLNQYRATGDGPVFFKFCNDPRITRIGKFLRNSSLDEIPQFINVLKGDMSLVGNRPLPLYEAATLTTNEFVERFTATAGITGLWQVKKRGKSEMSAEERIQLDIMYARNENLLYDFWIMASTPAALFQRTNA